MAWRPRPVTVAAGGISLAAVLACYDDGSSGFSGEDDPDDAWDGDEGEWLGDDDDEPQSDGCNGSSLVEHADGKTLFVRLGDTLFALDAVDGSARELLVEDGGWTIVSTAGSEALVLAGDEAIRIDTVTGEIARAVVPDTSHAVASPTGRWVRLDGGARWIRLLDAVTLTERTILVPDDAELRSVTWRPGTDEILALAESGDPEQRVVRRLYQWNLEDSAPIVHELPPLDQPSWWSAWEEESLPAWLSVSPDGRRVAVGGIDPLAERHAVTVVDLDAGEPQQLLDLQGPVGWTAEGRMVGWAADGYDQGYWWWANLRIVAVSADGGETVEVPIGGTDRPSFSLTPDGQRAIVWAYSPYYADDGESDWWAYDGEFVESWYAAALPLDGGAGQAISVHHAAPGLRFAGEDRAAFLAPDRVLEWLSLDPLAITAGEPGTYADFALLGAVDAIALSTCALPGRVTVRALSDGRLLHGWALDMTGSPDTADTGAADSDAPVDTDTTVDTADTASL